MKNLEKYGWNSSLQSHHNLHQQSGFEPARVISIKGFKHFLITEKGEKEAELSGKLLYGSDPELLPRTGDWVYYLDYESTGYIIDLFPRKNALSRRSSGEVTEKQVMAANIDYALIVQGLDRDFNLMRLDRYIVQVLSCGIEPVIILNKSDLYENVSSINEEIKRLGRECPVFFCSALTGSGLQEIKESVFIPAKTYILIGSSGAGKSSLLNAILGVQERETGYISDFTGKGRHVTTTRDLYMIPNGSLVIDSPGMREFGLTAFETENRDDLFPVISELANHCRFADCQHLNEAGCNVLETYRNGSLDPLIYESYLKLIKEQRHFSIRIEDKKRLGKQFGKMTREVKDFKNKNCQ